MIGVAIASITDEDPYQDPPSDNEQIASARETSERRIAALIANQEDVHNTPAWRDALSESRTIDLMSRASADPRVPRGRRSGIDRSKHTRVDIRWYAIPNQNKAAGGFLPMIEEDGKARGDTWRDRGWSKAEAETEAEEWAHRAASHFAGDWNIVVKKGRPTRRSGKPPAHSSRLPNVDTRKQALLEDAIEAVYNRKGSEDLTLTEACEAVRELLPSSVCWSRADVSDRTIAATIKRQIPNWF